MPTYRFRNKETNDEHELILKIADLDKYKESNPHLQQMITPVIWVAEPGGHIKTDDGFKEVMSKIKQTYKINNIKH